MKKKKWFIFLLVFCLVLLPLATSTVFADVGGGVDWDANDNDGFDFGGDSDSGGSIGGDIPFWAFYMLADNPVLFILVVIGFIIYSKFFKSSTPPARRPYQNNFSGSHEPQRPKDLNLEKLMEKDPNFSKESFLARVSNVFVTLQNAWTAKDWKAIRAFESNQLFNQHQTQLNSFIEKNQTNVVEDIAVLDTQIEEYSEDSANAYLATIVKARYRDFVIDDTTGQVIKGDRDRRYLMTYRMTFSRKIDAKTDFADEAHVTTCPNCGANLSINQHGICDYCGSEVTTGAMQWVLTALKPINQKVL